MKFHIDTMADRISATAIFLIVSLAIAAPAFANPSVIVNNQKITSTTHTAGTNPTQTAVCSDGVSGGDISVSADVSVTYDSSTLSGCYRIGCPATGMGNCNTGSGVRYSYPGTGTLAVTAGVTSLNCDNATPKTCSSPSVPEGSEGSNTLGISATATDDTPVASLTTCSCAGGPCLSSPPSPPNPSTTNNSQSIAYLLDVAGPTFDTTNTKFTSATTITQGGTVGADSVLTGGSSCTDFTLTGTATKGADTISGMVSGGLSFSSTASHTCPDVGNGIAQDQTNALAFVTNNSTPPGTYDVTLTASTKDLCGNDNSPSTYDLGDITVNAAASGVTSTTLVSSPTDSGEYENDICFTALQAKKKINASPGTVHVGEIVTFGGTGDSIDQDIVITLTIPDGFGWMTTGKSPQAHVFAGPAPDPLSLIDLHDPVDPNPPGWSEITGQTTITKTSSLTITITIPAGTIKDNWAAYARGHTQFVGPTLPMPDEPFEFHSSVQIDSGAVISSSGTLIGDPTCDGSGYTCSDGMETMPSTCDP